MLILKAIIYRILRIGIVLIVSFFVLGNIQTALSISIIDALVATIYYYYFDKFWDKVQIKLEHYYLAFKYRKFK